MKNKTAAIICEYNPLHLGHKYQIDLLREKGISVIIAVMSGSITQRGECAIADKHTRAYAALLAGVDLVVELPAPFAAMPGEYFARGGTIAADALRADYLSFGSDCGDIERLRSHASRARIASPGEGAAVKEYGGTGFASNDILAVEYIRAIDKYGLSLVPITHKREGQPYLSEDIACDMPSATAIRKELYYMKNKVIDTYLPPEVRGVFRSYDFLSKDSYDSNFYMLLRSKLCFSSTHVLSSYFGMGGGLASRMKRYAEMCSGNAEFDRLIKTKVYTDSRLKRSAMHAIAGIPQSITEAMPEYISLLGANQIGRAYLKSIDPKLPVLSEFSKKKKFKSFEYEKRFDIIFEMLNEMCINPPIWLRSPIIL